MKIQALIATAGTGTRLKTEQHKPFILLHNKPIVVHPLETFQRCSLIDSIIVVAHADGVEKIKTLAKTHDLDKVRHVVKGGAQRWQSVSNGLQVLDDDTELVAIHDGARPLLTNKLLTDVVEYAKQYDAVTTAVPVKPTIKKVDDQSMTVKETLDRKELWEIQTPQVFKKDVIVDAHRQKSDDNPTDDASMVEKTGVAVNVFMGDYQNIKITTEEDIVVAEALMAAQYERI